MATVARPRDTVPRRVPWSPRAWRQALYLAAGVPLQLLALAVVLIPSWSLSIPSWHHLLGERNWGRLAPLLLICLVIVFLAVPALTTMQRHRIRAVTGVDIPPQPALERRWRPAGMLAYVRSPATWRQLGYHLLAAPLLAVAAIAACVTWLAGLLCTLVYAYAWTRSPGGLLARGQSSPLDHLHRTLPVPGDVLLTLGGLVLLAAAPPRPARPRWWCSGPVTGCTSSSATTAWAAPIRPAAPAWPVWPSAPPRSTGPSRSPARRAALP